MASVCGIVSTLPTLIKDGIAKAPSWMQDPNLLWTLAIFAIYACFVFSVSWRDSRRSALQNTMFAEPYRKFSLLMDIMQKVGKKYTRYMRKMKAEKIPIRIVEKFVEDSRTKLPAFIQREIGTDERKLYDRTMKAVDSTVPRIAACQTSNALQRFVVLLFIKEAKSASKLYSEQIEFAIDRILPKVMEGSPVDAEVEDPSVAGDL